MRETALFKKIVTGATAALLFVLPCFAEFDFYSIPDSAGVRMSIEKSWLKTPLAQLKDKDSEVIKNEYGVNFEVRYEESDDEVSIIVAPESLLKIDLVKEGQSYVQSTKKISYPKNSPGSWILYRDKSTGKASRICYFFNQNADVYIQFRSEGNKTYADMLIYDFYAARSVPLGVNFNRLFTSSFSDVYRFTSKSLPWNYAFFVTGQYHSSMQMVAVIRENLKNIKYYDDLCYDEDGDLFSISKGEKSDIDDDEHICLSNAGFVKWVIDGIVEPISGKNIKPVVINQSTVSYNPLGQNGVMINDYWNLTFALDWNRNLAAECLSVRTNKEYTYESGGVDVTFNPFVFYNQGGTLKNLNGYIDNSGYSAKCLKSLMYVLAVAEPSWFYLASIREPSEKNKSDLFFTECAAIFPFFDDDGRFNCVVFKDGREMSIDDFIKNYNGADTFVHLERVKTTEGFFPKTLD